MRPCRLQPNVRSLWHFLVSHTQPSAYSTKALGLSAPSWSMQTPRARTVPAEGGLFGTVSRMPRRCRKVSRPVLNERRRLSITVVGLRAEGTLGPGGEREDGQLPAPPFPLRSNG